MKQTKQTLPNSGTKSIRSFVIDVPTDEAGPITFSVSSETPYLRDFGYEVLSHSPKAVDLTRLNTKAAVFVDHGGDQVGVVKRAWLEDKKIRVEVRFSPNPRGQEIERDIREGIRSNVSIGYIIKEHVRNKETAEDGNAIYTVTSWEPYEVSIVGVPADITVGVGRSSQMTQEQYDALKAVLDTAEVVDSASESEEVAEATEPSEPVETDEVKGGDESVEVQEIVAELTTTVEETGDSTESPLVIDETPVEDVPLENAQVEEKTLDISPIAIEAVESAAVETPQPLAESSPAIHIQEKSHMKQNLETPVTNVSLSTNETRELSFVGGIEALLQGDNSLLNEVGRDVARSHGIAPRSNAIYIPTNMPLFKSAYRDLTTTNNASALVANQYLTFEQAVHEQTLVGKLGIQFLDGVANQLVMPRAGGASGAWVTEGASISDSSGSYTTVTWAPKTYALTVPYTRQLGVLNGQYPAEQIVRQDILDKFLEVTEYGILAGSGSAQPSGLVWDTNTSQYNVTGSVSLDYFSQMWRTQREAKGGSSNLSYIVTPRTYSNLLSTAQFTNTGPAIMVNGTVNGFPVYASNHLPTTIGTTNDRHAALFGSYGRVLAAHFGVLEIVKDEYSAGSTGIVKLRGFMYMDSHARQPADIVRAGGIIVS